VLIPQTLTAFIACAATLMAFVFLIQLIVYKKRAVLLDGLFIDGTPMISTISYLLNDKKRVIYGQLDITKLSYSFEFIENEKTQGGGLEQTIKFLIEGVNKKSKPVNALTIMFSKSVFSNDYTVACYDEKNRTELHCRAEGKEGMQQFFKISLDGEGVAPDDTFRISVSLSFDKHSTSYRDAEFFIIDPANFSMFTKTHAIKILTNSSKVSEARLTLFRIKRSNYSRAEIYNETLPPLGNDRSNVQQLFERTFATSFRYIYLLRLCEKPQLADSLAYDTIVGASDDPSKASA